MKPTELAGMKTYTVGLFEAKEQHQQYSRNCKASVTITGIDSFILREMIISAMKKAMEWGARNGFTFGAEKTEIVLFTRRK